MTRGERFRSGGSGKVAQFLEQHQACDAGFDVARDLVVGGKLRITCKGCGAGVDYRAADARQLGEGPPGLIANGEMAGKQLRQAPRRVPPGPEGGKANGGERKKAKPRSRRPGAAAPAAFLIAAVISLGVVLIVVGAIRSGGDDQPSPPGGDPSAGQEQPAPTTTTPPAAAPEAPSDPQPPPEPGLRRRVVRDRFAIGVPAGWTQEVAGGAVTFRPRDGRALVRVFFEPGDRPLERLSRSAAGFLATEHPDATITGPRMTRLAGRQGARVRASYPSGVELAGVLTGGGHSFLVLRRVDRVASDRVRREADRVFASFRPR